MLPPAVERSLLESWAYFVHLSVVPVPLFVGASFLVGVAGEYLPPERIEGKLRSHDEGPGNVAAAGLGAVPPFCSCSTVPVLAGLVQAGAPLGLAVSSLLASPLVNELAVMLHLGLFGIEVTLWYVVVPFGSAVVGGLVIGRSGLAEHVTDVSIAEEGERAVAVDGGTVAVPTDGQIPTRRTHRCHVEQAARDAWPYFVETLPYLLLGMVVGALIHGVVPVGVLRSVLGPKNPLALPLAALAGAPVYVSLSGMVPIAAAPSERGIAVGTVLPFVIGGAGVSIPNLILPNRLFERRLLLIYAGTVVAIGTTAGIVFNLLPV